MNHQLSKSHQSALQPEEEFKAVSSREKVSVLESLNQSYSTSVKKNTVAIIDIVIGLAKRGILSREAGTNLIIKTLVILSFLLIGLPSMTNPWKSI